MNSYTQITTKYIKVQKRRTILTIIGITMSIALICGLGTILFSYRDARIQETIHEKGNYEVSFRNISKDQTEILKKHTEFKDVSLSQNIGYGKIYTTPTEEKQKFTPNYRYIYLKAYDNKSLKDTFSFKLNEGRFPQNKDEIVLEKGALNYIDKNLKLGDKIKIPFGNRKSQSHSDEILSPDSWTDDEIFEPEYEREFTLVGIIQPQFFSTGNFLFDAITFFDEKSAADNNYTAFMKVVSNKNKIAIAKNAAESMGLTMNQNGEIRDDSQVKFNEQLLRLYWQSENSNINSSLINTSIFMVVLIIVCTVALIYNAFNISVIERISQFGILRSIGATPHQIRRIVFREAFIMSIIAIPLGLLSGVFAIKIVFLLLGNLEFLSMTEFKVKAYPLVLIISSLLGLLTVFLSALIPAAMAGRVSPLEAVRNSKNIKRERFRRSKSGRLFKLLFKTEGFIAYKNVKRNKKRFIITVFSLVISIIMFITFNSFVNIAKASNMGYKNKNFDASVWNNSPKGFTKEDYEEIKGLKGMEKIYRNKEHSASILIPKDKINPNYTFTSQRRLDHEYEEKYKDHMLLSCRIIAIDENNLNLFNDHIISGKVDMKSLDDMGILIVNKNKVRANKKQYVNDLTTYKVGDTLSTFKTFGIESIDEVLNAKKMWNLKIAGILDVNPVDDSYPNNELFIITSQKTYEKLVGNNKTSTLLLKLTENENERENVKKFFEEKSKRESILYEDHKEMAKQSKTSEFQMKVFVYGFITVITLISAVNIINTISTNLLLRKREFATLKAIGMCQGQLKKLVILEGTIHGILASIFGSIVGTILSYALQQTASPVMEVGWKIPWNSILIASIGSIVISLLSSLWPLKKIEKQNIVDNIRMEE